MLTQLRMDVFVGETLSGQQLQIEVVDFVVVGIAVEVVAVAGS